VAERALVQVHVAVVLETQTLLFAMFVQVADLLAAAEPDDNGLENGKSSDGADNNADNSPG
jgi:hypothetical protein